METITQYSEIAAAFTARVFLGFLFFFQGYDSIFEVRIRNIVAAYEDSFSSKRIPRFLTVSGVWFTSLTEFFGGLLLILGLMEPIALYLLALNMLIAGLAFSIVSPMWDMKHVFPRLALVVFLLVIPPDWKIWSLDHLLLTLK